MKKILAIVGGGAVGLSSAIHAYNFSKGKINIIILEKMDRVGKKILATGNGRCNFTNINATYKNFYSQNKDFPKYFLDQFTPKQTIDFFYNLGVLHTVLENGKVYPFSQQASSILDALRNKIDSLNIPIKTNFEVVKIDKKNGQFNIIAKNGENILCDKIIFGAGGMASANLGSDGGGLRLLKSMGHSHTKLVPALVQLKTQTDKIKALKGIKIIGNLKIYSNDKFLKEDFGEILFTDYGISGPPVFQLSTLFSMYKNLIAYIDFMPKFSENDVFKILKDRQQILNYTNMENYFNGLLNKRLGNIVAKTSGIEKMSFLVKDLTDDLLKKMAYNIKNYKLDILDTNGFNNAQVMAGGLKTTEFDDKTLQSKIINGLYCAGEILDVLGDCGGFNLQWAWASSYVATKCCVESMLK